MLDDHDRYLDRTIDASPVLAQIKGKRHTLPNGHDFESGWCDETGSLIVCLEEKNDPISILCERESDWTTLYLNTDIANIAIGLRPEQLKKLFNELRRQLGR